MTDTAWIWQGGDKQAQPPACTASRVTTGGNEGEPVCIGVVEGPLRAEIARGYLEDAGLTVFLQGEAVASVYGMVSGPLAEVRVYVPGAQAEEAARVFATFDHGSDGSLHDD